MVTSDLERFRLLTGRIRKMNLEIETITESEEDYTKNYKDDGYIELFAEEHGESVISIHIPEGVMSSFNPSSK